MSPYKDHEAAKAARRKRYAEDPEFRRSLLDATKRHIEANRERYNAYHSKLAKEARRKDPEKFRVGDYRAKFKVTVEWYEEQFKKQGGVCAICGRPETGQDNFRGNVRRLSVDHNHKCCPGAKSCGKCVRGLLCSKCNPALAVVEDISDWGSKALAYLAQYA